VNTYQGNFCSCSELEWGVYIILQDSCDFPIQEKVRASVLWPITTLFLPIMEWR